MRYGADTIAALLDVFRIIYDYALLLIEPKILIVLIGGSLFAGLFTEFAARRWR